MSHKVVTSGLQKLKQPAKDALPFVDVVEHGIGEYDVETTNPLPLAAERFNIRDVPRARDHARQPLFAPRQHGSRRVHTDEFVDFRRAKDLHSLIAAKAGPAPVIKHRNPRTTHALPGKTNQLLEDGKLLPPYFVVNPVVVLRFDFVIEKVESPHQFRE
jgi:hypothetical protein